MGLQPKPSAASQIGDEMRSTQETCASPEAPDGTNVLVKRVEELQQILVQNRGGADKASRVVFFLDQFEQWLQNCNKPGNSLIETFKRFGDGGYLQAVLIVRQEYSVPAEQFWQKCGVGAYGALNKHIVKLLDLTHAANALREFGKRMGKTPTDEFVASAISELKNKDDDEEVIPVRLATAVFMLRNKEWTNKVERGVFEQLGIQFLRETFADPQYRPYCDGAQLVMYSLLRDDDSGNKGAAVPRAKLKEMTGTSDQGFEQLINKLDRELYLVTAKFDESVSERPSTGSNSGTSYELTHDYLVPWVRQWTQEGAQKNRRLQVYMRYAQLTKRFDSTQSADSNAPNLLPSVTDRIEMLKQLPHREEWLEILKHVPRGERELNAMMKAANKFYVNEFVKSIDACASNNEIGSTLDEHEQAIMEIGESLQEALSVDGGNSDNRFIALSKLEVRMSEVRSKQ